MNQNPDLNNLNNIPTINPTQPESPVMPTQNSESNSIPVMPSMSENVTSVSNESTDIKNLQTIPNVEQTNEQFISNTQSTVKKEETSKGNDSISLVFLIIIFGLVLAAIVFLFPILLNR